MVGEGGTPPSKAGGLGGAQGRGLTHTRCQSLLTRPEIPHSQAHASSAPSPALSPWPGRSGQAGSAPRAERRACSPALQCSQAVHQADDLLLLSEVAGWSQASRQHLRAPTLLPQDGQPPLCHPSGCCLVKWEEKKQERSGSMGLLISLEQSPPSSSGIISLKATNQHKTPSCSAPSATRGLGAGRPRLLTAFARQTWL